MSLVAQITGASPQARILSAVTAAQLSVANPAKNLTPILPNSVVSSSVGGGAVQAQAALIPAGGISLIGTPFVEADFVLTAQHIADRGVTLSRAPADPRKVEFIPYGGPEQRANVDFVVTGTSLSWAGLSLELLLQAGDAITVRYVSA